MPKANADMNKSSKPKVAEKTSKRLKDDAYLTPPWCVHRLLEVDALGLPGGRWLEPAAGPGRIISSVNSMRDDVHGMPSRFGVSAGMAWSGR
jgi:hypothetical protein